MSIWVTIFVCFSIFLSQKHFFENFRHGIIPLDFMVFPFRTSKSKNDINYIKYQFSHKFEKVCKWLNMYYSNTRILIFFKVTTMSVWIILKNLLWTYMECTFCHFLATIPCIHPWWRINLRLINWCPHVGQRTLGGGYKHVEEMRVGWGV